MGGRVEGGTAWVRVWRWRRGLESISTLSCQPFFRSLELILLLSLMSILATPAAVQISVGGFKVLPKSWPLDIWMYKGAGERTMAWKCKSKSETYLHRYLCIPLQWFHSCGSGSAAHPRWHINVRCVMKVFCLLVAWRRYQETRRYKEEVGKGQRCSSRTTTFVFVQRGRGGALPEPCRMTSSRSQMSRCLLKWSETGSMTFGIRAWHLQVRFVLAAQHYAKHQVWQVHTEYMWQTWQSLERLLRRYCCLLNDLSLLEWTNNATSHPLHLQWKTILEIFPAFN